MRGFRSRGRQTVQPVKVKRDRVPGWTVTPSELQKPPRSRESLDRLNRDVKKAQKVDRTLPGGTGPAPQPPRKPTRAERRAAKSQEPPDGTHEA